jgi:hypothetical protein
MTYPTCWSLPDLVRGASIGAIETQTAQRILACGVGFGAAAWGGGQLLTGAGQLVSAATGFLVTIASIVLMLTVARRRGLAPQGKTVNITNNNRWAAPRHARNPRWTRSS